MIYTITLNPAIDHAVFIEEHEISRLNHVKSRRKEPAGKGINVSRVLHQLGYKTTVCTIIGGTNGTYIIDELENQGIPLITETIDGNSRENIKVIPEHGDVHEYNEHGPQYDVKRIDALLKKLFSKTTKGDSIVISGSIPKGIPNDIYASIIHQCHDNGLIVLLDASGEALRYGIEAKPDIIKPNITELEELFNMTIRDLPTIVKCGKRLLNKGIKEVIITLGGDGTIHISEQQVIQIDPIRVAAINTVGAGDSFVAGYVAMMSNNQNVEHRLAYATAVATTSVEQETTVLTDSSNIKRYQSQVQSRHL